MDTLDLAKKIVEINTETPVKDTESFKPITELLESENIDYHFHSFDSVKTLIASFGDGKPHICFNGHLDVVPAGQGWEKTGAYEPKELDGRFYGRGSSDMKGGLAAEINAFIRLKEGKAFNGKLSLMIPGDEELGGSRGTEKILEEYSDYDYALIAEPTDMQLQIGFRGKCHLEIILKGKSTHASRPHLVENVLTNDLVELIELLSDIKWNSDENLPDTTSTITQINTENPQNSLPGKVKIGMDIRNNTAQDTEDILEKIRDTLPDHIEYQIELNHVKPAVLVEDREFIEKVDEATKEVIGETPKHVTEGGSSDGAHFSRHDIPSLEIGPEQDPIHAPDEYCSIEHLENIEEIFYRTALKLDQ